MDKSDLIACICDLNASANPEHLKKFTEEELNAYFEHLLETEVEELAPRD